jgi:peroxiredoxin
MSHLAPRLTGALLGVALFLASAVALADKPVLKVGDEPPDVFGKASSRETVHLTDYRGRIVVISFFASWCGPCRKEVPMLMALQKHATRDKVVVISVNWQQSQDEFRHIKKIFDDHGSDITLVSDERGRVGAAYGVHAIPFMIIVGKDGKIVALHLGYGEDEIPVIADEINAAWNKDLSDSSPYDSGGGNP